MNSSTFIGTWRLISCETRTPEGKRLLPFGKNPKGFLIYTPNGYMSANIMKENRPPLGIDPEKAITPLVLFNPRYWRAFVRYFMASRKYLSYNGKYEARNGQVVHHVDGSLLPDWIGTDLVREYKMSDDQLELTAKTDSGFSHCLIWERVI